MVLNPLVRSTTPESLKVLQASLPRRPSQGAEAAVVKEPKGLTTFKEITERGRVGSGKERIP